MFISHLVLVLVVGELTLEKKNSFNLITTDMNVFSLGRESGWGVTFNNKV